MRVVWVAFAALALLFSSVESQSVLVTRYCPLTATPGSTAAAISTFNSSSCTARAGYCDNPPLKVSSWTNIANSANCTYTGTTAEPKKNIGYHMMASFSIPARQADGSITQAGD